MDIVRKDEKKRSEVLLEPLADNKPLQILDDSEKGKTPDTPINDSRVEKFLMDVVENAVSGTDNLYRIYNKYGFPKNAPVFVCKNQMRNLLSTERVRERLKYLRELEWEFSKPDVLSISRKFEQLIDDEELMPKDKISALNSLSKLVGLLDRESEKKNSGSQIAIVFNGQEKAPEINVTK